MVRHVSMVRHIIVLTYTWVLCYAIDKSNMKNASFDCTAKEAGTLRIVNELSGMNQTNIDVKYKEGRLEVCLPILDKYRWGTFCDDSFSHDDAAVICQSFTKKAYGYAFSTGTAYGRNEQGDRYKNTIWKIGSDSQPYYMDEMNCKANDKWYECSYSVDDSQTNITIRDSTGNEIKIKKPKTNCNHKEDAFIKCKEVLECYHCQATNYDGCSAVNLNLSKCHSSMNACFRKVAKTYGGEMEVSQGCQTEASCDSYLTECKKNAKNQVCFCNVCQTTQCNSLFQILAYDFSDFSVKYGTFVNWIISNFTRIMRFVMFDVTAFQSLLSSNSTA